MRKNSPYNPANLLSLIRVVLVPVFVIFMQDGRGLMALAVFVGASLTDFLDGWMARRFGWTSRLGEFIDPLGDKLLTLSALVMLHLAGKLPFWTVAVGFMRELMVVTGFVLLAVVARRTAVKASLAGKAATLLQMVFMGLLLGSGPFQFSVLWTGFAAYGLMGAVVVNFFSGLDYALRGIQDYEKSRKGQKA